MLKVLGADNYQNADNNGHHNRTHRPKTTDAMAKAVRFSNSE